MIIYLDDMNVTLIHQTCW